MLAIISPLIYSRLLANGTDLSRYALISTITILSTNLFIVYFNKRATLLFNKIFLIPFILFVWSSISLLWSLDTGNSFIEIPRFFSSILVLFLGMQIRFYKQQNFIINGAVASCFLVVLIGLLQAFNFNPFNIYYLSLPASTFINPNHASIYIEFFIPVLFFLVLYKDDGQSKTLYTVTLTLALSFLYILSSFGTLIALFLTILIASFILSKYSNLTYTIKKNNKYLAAILIGTVSITSIYSYTPIAIEYEKKPISLITQKNSHIIRLALYTKSLNMIKDNLLTGTGYAGFRSGIIPYISEVQSITKHDESRYYQETHNDFLQQFTETGIIGGLLFISFFAIILYLGLGIFKNKKITEKNIFIFSISSGLLVLILHSFIDFPFHLSTSNYLIYLVSGFILSSSATKVFIKKNVYSKISTLLILISLSFFLLFSINSNTKHIKSNKLVRDAAIAIHKEKNCNRAIKLIDKSNQLFEFDFQSQASQAQIYGVCPQDLVKQRNVIQQLVNLNPTNFRARFLRGNIFLAENNLTSAFNDFYYIVKTLPNSALGYIGMGKWAIKLNKIKDARIYLEKAKDFDPDNFEIEFLLKQLNVDSR